MAFFSKLIYKFNSIPITISIDYFAETDKLVLKFIWNCKGPRIAKVMWKNNKAGGVTLPDFRTYDRTQSSVIVTQRSMEYN